MAYDEHHDDEKLPIAIPLPELKTMAIAVADEMKNAQQISGALRERFINVRAALFQRGIFDPVLVRFDSATVTHASMQEIAEELATVAGSL